MDDVEFSVQSWNTYLVVHAKSNYCGVNCTLLYNFHDPYCYTNCFGRFCIKSPLVFCCNIPICLFIRNNMLIYWAILFSRSADLVRKVSSIWGFRLSRSGVSSQVPYVMLTVMNSLLSLNSFHDFIWFNIVFCYGIFFSSKYFMGNCMYDGVLLVDIIGFACCQLYIYGFYGYIMSHRGILFASNQVDHLLMKCLVPYAKFSLWVLKGCFRSTHMLISNPRSQKVFLKETSTEVWSTSFFQNRNLEIYLPLSLDVLSLDQVMNS